jgi:hypothetical protein
MQIPDYPVTFEWTISLAMTGRAPCKVVADQLRAGETVRLRREPGNPHDTRAIAVVNPAGQTAGYLYALEAGLLYLLLDCTPPVADRSVVEAILGPGHSRRSPVYRIRLRLDLASAASLFTLITVLALKDESFLRRFDFAANPWLAPLDELHRAYRRAPDEFSLPLELVDEWTRFCQLAQITDEDSPGLKETGGKTDGRSL